MCELKSICIQQLLDGRIARMVVAGTPGMHARMTVIGRLADHTGLEVIYVSKLARALERAGLIQRTTDPADARAVELTLTGRGRVITDRAVVIVGDLQEELTAPLGGPRSVRTKALTRELKALLAG